MHFLVFAFMTRRQLVFCASATVFIHVLKKDMSCFMTLALVLYLIASPLIQYELFHSQDRYFPDYRSQKYK